MNAIMSILQNSEAVWKSGLKAIIVAVILLLLKGIFRQLKSLNNSLKSISGNMQAYFDVILTEEEEPEKELPKENESMNGNPAIEAEAIKKREEEEKLFNAVLQEYFS